MVIIKHNIIEYKSERKIVPNTNKSIYIYLSIIDIFIRRGYFSSLFLPKIKEYPYMIFPCGNIITSPQITILVSSDTTRNKLVYKEGVKKKITPGKLQLLNEILLNNLLLICWHLFFCFPPLSNGLPCQGPSSSPIFYWKQSPASKQTIISKIKIKQQTSHWQISFPSLALCIPS